MDIFPSFPFLSFAISLHWPEKRLSMESCQVLSALAPELRECVPKEPNFEFELFED